jgi:hypothetical protein
MMNMLVHESGTSARLAVADLTRGGVEIFRSLLPSVGARIVYSDPPWNPGNEKYWRRYAGQDPPTNYRAFLDAWCACAASCGADHIFCEQSVIDAHRTMLLDAVDRCPDWTLPLLEQWTVLYGSPKRPNVLLHFGRDRLTTDPSGMAGVKMTSRVFDGVSIEAGMTVADPCTGLGTTARVAHTHGCSFVGTELNPARLARTEAWLRGHGYR